jgi:hypothetical protein
LEKIKLNKKNPEMEFKLNSEDSYLLILSAFVTSQKNIQNEWTNFISKIKLSVELSKVIEMKNKGLEMMSFDAIKDEFIGKKGTFKRKQYEQKLQLETSKFEIAAYLENKEVIAENLNTVLEEGSNEHVPYSIGQVAKAIKDNF